MNDEIATRLRATATEERPLWRGEMMEAADEIERLLNKVKQLEAEVSRLERLSNG